MPSYQFSVWRTKGELDQKSTELADARLRAILDRMADQAPQRMPDTGSGRSVKTAKPTSCPSMRAPSPSAVRVEEFVNYFDYDYPNPKEGAFGVNLEAAPSPFSTALMFWCLNSTDPSDRSFSSGRSVRRCSAFL